MEFLQTLLGYFRNSEMLNSKKFRAFLIGIIVLSLKHFGVANVDPELLNYFITLVLGYMGFQGGVDMIKAYAGFYSK